MCNVFNVANHQNVDGLGTTAYKLSGTTATFQGQGTSNPSNNTYQDTHQLQQQRFPVHPA